jgi:hypothetical protein
MKLKIETNIPIPPATLEDRLVELIVCADALTEREKEVVLREIWRMGVGE